MKTIKRLNRLLLFLWLILFLPPKIAAQEEDNSSFMNRASQYVLGAKDEILVKVNIWGFVSKPGQYLVPRHTDLISLMSFAGGPREGANLTKVRIIREKLETDGSNGRDRHEAIFEIDVKKYLNTGKKGLIPNLEAGDTVLITQSFGSKFRNILGVTSVVGLIAASATLIFAIERL